MLDLEEISSLMREADLPREVAPPLRPGLAVGSMDDDLMDAVIRLSDLLRKPAQIAVLAPLIRREIFYRLLLSEQGGLLRRIAADSGKVQRVAAGLAWLKRNLERHIRMEELAREMQMSPSAMHTWFRAVTSMSPLQYQKQLRLQEARRILLSESLDAGTASRRVGYESASQFSREYRRFFGNPADAGHRASPRTGGPMTLAPGGDRLSGRTVRQEPHDFSPFSKSTSTVPYRCPLRHAQSTPRTRTGGGSEAGAVFFSVRRIVSAVVSRPMRSARRAPASPAQSITNQGKRFSGSLCPAAMLANHFRKTFRKDLANAFR